MYPTKPEDFFIPEPFGNLLFTVAPTVYYADIECRYGDPISVTIKKIERPNFLRTMEGYFSQGEYHIWFNVREGVSLKAYEFKKQWSFDKSDVLRYVQTDPWLKHIRHIDETMF